MGVYRNSWIGEQAGDVSGLIRISPMLFAQKGLMNIFRIPKLRDLPINLDLKAIVFDFGFDTAPTNPGLAPFDTQDDSKVIERPMLLWGITGVASYAGAAPAGSQNNYQVMFFHTHNGVQRQLFNKRMLDSEVIGTAQQPNILRTPYLMLPGDSIQIEVNSMTAGTPTKIQVCLLGGEFD